METQHQVMVVQQHVEENQTDSSVNQNHHNLVQYAKNVQKIVKDAQDLLMIIAQNAQTKHLKDLQEILSAIKFNAGMASSTKMRNATMETQYQEMVVLSTANQKLGLFVIIQYHKTVLNVKNVQINVKIAQVLHMQNAQNVKTIKYTKDLQILVNVLQLNVEMGQ